jgi:hypothetical protein
VWGWASRRNQPCESWPVTRRECDKEPVTRAKRLKVEGSGGEQEEQEQGLLWSRPGRSDEAATAQKRLAKRITQPMLVRCIYACMHVSAAPTTKCQVPPSVALCLLCVCSVPPRPRLSILPEPTQPNPRPTVTPAVYLLLGSDPAPHPLVAWRLIDQSLQVSTLPRTRTARCSVGGHGPCLLLAACWRMHTMTDAEHTTPVSRSRASQWSVMGRGVCVCAHQWCRVVFHHHFIGPLSLIHSLLTTFCFADMIPKEDFDDTCQATATATATRPTRPSLNSLAVAHVEAASFPSRSTGRAPNTPWRR